jgi:hypothetical protein
MMYFSWFKKDSPGRDLYGKGFVLNYKHRTFVFGVKGKRTNFRISKLKTKNQKTYIIFAGICIIHITIRNIKKDMKQYARRIWRSRTHFVSSRGK